MQLYERVKCVATKFSGSQAALGEALGMSGRTFQGYLTKARQDNLWPLLTQIHALYPQIRREWLWWGEGAMLTSDQSEKDSEPTLRDEGHKSVHSLQARMQEMERELAEERRLNRQLTARLLVDGVGDKGAASSTGKTGEERG